MIPYPEFTENKESSVVLYFPLEGKNEREFLATLETFYACCTSVGVVLRDGKKYAALEIEDDA